MSVLEQLDAQRGALTAPELANLLNLHPQTVYRLAKSGRLPSYRIASCIRFDPHAVAEYLRTHEVRA